MEIRREAAADFERVRAVVQEAFGRDDEALLVTRLRRSEGVLSLVAVEGGIVVGHAMFSPVTVGRHAVVARGLAPVAVAVAHQRRGVGTRLIEHGIAALRNEGVALVVVLGHPDYYARFGFVPAAPLGLHCKWGRQEGAFRVRELVAGSLTKVRGRVEYLATFDASAW
jgi:putative acetyltransferase